MALPRPPIVLHLNDVVELRKAHPCGNREWTVVRLGADIGLRCLGCGHKVLLPRRTLEKRLKSFVSRGVATAEVSDAHAADDPEPGPDSGHGLVPE